MIPENLSQLEIKFYKVAKEHEITMILSNETKIEVNETNRDKFKEFARSIATLSPDTKVIDIIEGGEYKDTRGNNIRGNKAKYLVDNDYYNRLIGQQEASTPIEHEQVTLF